MTVAELLALAERDPPACVKWMTEASSVEWKALPIMNSASGPVLPHTDGRGPRLLRLPPLPNIMKALE